MSEVPFVPLILLVLLLPLAVPLLLWQRYRIGKARRRGRRWAAKLSLFMLSLSCLLFLVVAALSSFWAPRAFLFSLAGLLAGGFLGMLGLRLTRWEKTPSALYYTPNRWLVLFLTLAVTIRLLYAIGKAWHTWSTHGPDTSWWAAAGIPGSLGVGAMVLGHYLIYAAGVYRRLGEVTSAPPGGTRTNRPDY